MAIKRKTRDEETEPEKAIKKQQTRIDDRLSILPDDLQLRILSSLDTKQAVQTSMMLSKTWGSLWTSTPILDFNYNSFHDEFIFRKFINRVLHRRDQSVKLDRLSFTQIGISSAKILKKVFHYAFSHGVKHLEAYIYVVNGGEQEHTWPGCNFLHDTSFESLTSLKLKSGISTNCPFLGPRISKSFTNLTVLHLTRALITDLDPFSGFPVLEKLTLVHCEIKTEAKTLNLHALNLSELSISNYEKFNYCNLTTPKLKFFEYRGCNFLPLFQTNYDRDHVLDTMVIGCGSYHPYRKRMFDNMLALFGTTLGNVKSLTLHWSTVEILSSFQEELMKQRSPFWKLKCLKLDFRHGFIGSSKSDKAAAADVKAFFLKNLQEVGVKTIYQSSGLPVSISHLLISGIPASMDKISCSHSIGSNRSKRCWNRWIQLIRCQRGKSCIFKGKDAQFKQDAGAITTSRLSHIFIQSSLPIQVCEDLLQHTKRHMGDALVEER
ncbi:hypothetical protein LXL04_013238 [Taraxacum kok-saghyz]